MQVLKCGALASVLALLTTSPLAAFSLGVDLGIVDAEVSLGHGSLASASVGVGGSSGANVDATVGGSGGLVGVEASLGGSSGPGVGPGTGSPSVPGVDVTRASPVPGIASQNTQTIIAAYIGKLLMSSEGTILGVITGVRGVDGDFALIEIALDPGLGLSRQKVLVRLPIRASSDSHVWLRMSRLNFVRSISAG